MVEMATWPDLTICQRLRLRVSGVGSGSAAVATCRRGVAVYRTATGADTGMPRTGESRVAAIYTFRGATRHAKCGRTGWLRTADGEFRWLESLVVGLVAAVEGTRNA